MQGLFIVFKMECSICLLEYSLNRKPKLLIPCGHSVCTACGKKILFCPICRTSIKDLVINFSLLNIKYSGIDNKQSIEEEEDNAKLHETASPI